MSNKFHQVGLYSHHIQIEPCHFRSYGLPSEPICNLARTTCPSKGDDSKHVRQESKASAHHVRYEGQLKIIIPKHKVILCIRQH